LGGIVENEEAEMADVPVVVPIQIHTPHRLITKTGDGRDLVVVSGYAEVRGGDLQGNPNGTWRHRDLSLFPVGGDWREPPHDVVPVVSMTSIMNVDVATNAGWAIDDCRVQHVGGPGKHQVGLLCRVGVRDRDGFMFRVNFYVTMIGHLLP
jgi:hypothetical protein